MTNLQTNLEQFTGTESYHKVSMLPSAPVITDGVKYLIDQAQAYWLIDAVASYMRKEPFQVWKLVKAGKGAVLTMQEDSSEPVLVTQKIEFTDFPLDSVDIWVIDGVALLPSEY